MSTAIRTPLLGVSLSNKWKNLKSLLCPWHNFNAHLPTYIYFNSAGHAYYKNGNQLQLWLIIIKILNKEIVSAYTQPTARKHHPCSAQPPATLEGGRRRRTEDGFVFSSVYLIGSFIIENPIVLYIYMEKVCEKFPMVQKRWRIWTTTFTERCIYRPD